MKAAVAKGGKNFSRGGKNRGQARFAEPTVGFAWCKKKLQGKEKRGRGGEQETAREKKRRGQKDTTTGGGALSLTVWGRWQT